MNRRTFVNCTAFAFLTTGVSNTGSAQSLRECLSDPKLRRGVAEGYRKAFSGLDEKIPTLSPDEDHWLRIEIDDTERQAGGVHTARALAAMDSKAYSLRVTKPHVRQIIEVLDGIIAQRVPGQRGEIRLWAQLAVLFMDFNFWQEIAALVSRGIVEKMVDGVEQFYFQNHVLWAETILRNVVIPSL